MDSKRQIELLKKYKDEAGIDEEDRKELEELYQRRLIIFNSDIKRRTAQITEEGQIKIGLY